MAEKFTEYRGYNLGPGMGSTVVIKAMGQGRVPKPLTGLFTSYGEARNQVDNYLNSLLKGPKNAKTKNTRTG